MYVPQGRNKGDGRTQNYFSYCLGFLARSSGCFRLVVRAQATARPQTTQPALPTQRPWSLLCVLFAASGSSRQIWSSTSPRRMCSACSHCVFTRAACGWARGAPCKLVWRMGLLGPCRLKSFLRQSIYFHSLLWRKLIDRSSKQTFTGPASPWCQ